MAYLDLDSFVRSLKKDDPPVGLPVALMGVWHGMRGEWDRSHELVQGLDTADGAWVHAWLHRIEGDIGNAGYWYRRAGKPAGTGNTDREGLDIAASLLAAGTAEA